MIEPHFLLQRVGKAIAQASGRNWNLMRETQRDAYRRQASAALAAAERSGYLYAPDRRSANVSSSGMGSE
jgi:hypothetical protein